MQHIPKDDEQDHRTHFAVVGVVLVKGMVSELYARLCRAKAMQYGLVLISVWTVPDAVKAG